MLQLCSPSYLSNLVSMRFGFWHSPPYMLEEFSFPAFPWSLLTPKEVIFDECSLSMFHLCFRISDCCVWYSTFKWKEGNDRLPEHSGQDYDKKNVLATLRTCVHSSYP